MNKKRVEHIEDQIYRFSDIVIIAHKYDGGRKTTWRVVCQKCGDKLLVQRVSAKYWIARCHKCWQEYTITPAEYYIMRKEDFSKIMGAL